MANPPKFAPQRQGRSQGPRRLPASGRSRRAPAWPLSTKATRAEADAWTQLWRTPQAVAWEELGCVRQVARYCRAMVAAEAPGAPPALHGQVTAMEDRLGLTPKSMRLLLWTIVDDDLAAQRNTRTATKRTAAKKAPASRRLAAVKV